jgi:hypothetical protein
MNPATYRTRIISRARTELVGEAEDIKRLSALLRQLSRNGSENEPGIPLSKSMSVKKTPAFDCERKHDADIEQIRSYTLRS